MPISHPLLQPLNTDENREINKIEQLKTIIDDMEEQARNDEIDYFKMEDLKEENENLKEELGEKNDIIKKLKDAILYTHEACLCDRFPGSFTPKNKRGFDYGETHPMMGKCGPGKRWKTPRAYLEDNFGFEWENNEKKINFKEL